MTTRRMFIWVAVALIVGAALALALAFSQSPAASSQGAVVASQAGGKAKAAGDEVAQIVDPAKKEPVLDSFKAKDPFAPSASTSPSGGGATPVPTKSPSSTSPSVSYVARVLLDKTSFTVKKGTKIPKKNPAFIVDKITAGDLTFKILDGELAGGKSSFSVSLGESVDLEFSDGAKYTIKVVSIERVGASGALKGHSLSVLSITKQNGKPLVTLKVDTKTYPDLAVGRVITTSWGQLKILAIDADAQTATILHGDQTIVIHAGQVVIK